MNQRRGDRVQGYRTKGILIVKCQINAIYYGDFLVDTGAAMTAISQKFADEMDSDITKPIRHIQIASARKVALAPVVKLDTLQVGSQKLHNADVLVLSLPSELRVDGLLGVNFLEKFRVTFEFDRATLILRTKTP